MRALAIAALASGCVYASPSVGVVRASQTTDGTRWVPYLAAGAGLRSTSDAPVRCGGGAGFLLTGNSYGTAYGVGPEARCNLRVADAGVDRRWAVQARAMLGWGWLTGSDTGATTARGRAVTGYAGVAYEMLSDGEFAAGADHRPVAFDVALGLTGARLDVGDDHYSWVGLGVEATLAFDLVYYLDQTGASR